ncbi:MAG: hypothetical protein ABI920_17970 [Casimicrobiaceae bacterium]
MTLAASKDGLEGRRAPDPEAAGPGLLAPGCVVRVRHWGVPLRLAAPKSPFDDDDEDGDSWSHGGDEEDDDDEDEDDDEEADAFDDEASGHVRTASLR